MARRSAFVILAGAIAFSAFPASVFAQAWVPSRGEGSVSILFQDLFVENHLTATGEKQARGEIHSNNLTADVSYGLTDRLALTLAVPYIRTRYSGAARHPSDMDDGTPHSAFQDVRFPARFNVLDGPVTITPFVGTSVPSHSYEYFAHAAYGPRVRELEVGAYVGRIVPVGRRPAFVQARYAYGFLEEIVGIERSRSSLDVEVGYFFSPRVRAFVLGAGQKTHGGVDLPDAGWRAMPDYQQEHHDRIGRIDIFDVGGGVQMSLTRSVEVFGSFMTTLAGENAHSLARGVTVGASWSFGRGVPSLIASAARKAGKTDPPTERQMIRCLCQKK